MLHRIITGLLVLLLIWTGCPAKAETQPLTAAELEAMAANIREMANRGILRNDPSLPEAESEDGYAFQYDFGVIYADSTAWSEETEIHAAQIMDSEVAGPRGLAVDLDVNQVMAAVPCGNKEMNGTYEAAVLYLIGDAASGFSYGRVERNGQRITAIEYGVWDPGKGKRMALTLGISGDGVASMRLEGLAETFDVRSAEELYAELEALTHQFAYARVPRSLNGADLEMFNEGDLDFPSLSFRTAVPEIFGDNVEDLLMDNEDGTWLRRIDGDGFEAVFTSNSRGGEASLVSYTILSPELEGPRCVRLGDLFHEDYTRFRSGEGSMDADGQKEVLYGVEGAAPYGIAEYGNGTEMTLRYVTPTLGGPDVEMILKYEDTVLTEIILHTLEEDE